jgi:hypothetical protein
MYKYSNNQFCDFAIECQFVESLLKKGISLCSKSVEISLAEYRFKKFKEKRIKSDLFYNVDIKKLDELSMGELIKRFEKFVNKKCKLIGKLRKLKDERNYLIHKIFVEITKPGEEQNFDDEKLDKILKRRIGRAIVLAEDCYTKLEGFLVNI